MSKLTDSVTKNFSPAKKKEFFKRYNDLLGSASEDAIVDIVLRELFEEKFSIGGRVGLKDGLSPKDQTMGPVYSTNDPKEAAQEIVKRLIKLESVGIPIDNNLSFNLGPGLDGISLEGIFQILGGELSVGAGKKGDQKGIGFNFFKKFKKGGLVDKPLGAGGKKSGPPPKRGPNPQGLNIKSNTAKTVKLEK